jgi:hypothetical protein
MQYVPKDVVCFWARAPPRRMCHDQRAPDAFVIEQQMVEQNIYDYRPKIVSGTWRLISRSVPPSACTAPIANTYWDWNRASRNCPARGYRTLEELQKGIQAADEKHHFLSTNLTISTTFMRTSPAKTEASHLQRHELRGWLELSSENSDNMSCC